MTTIKEPNKRLFIGGIPFRFTEGELLALFIPFGKVLAIKIIQTKWGKSRGIGYVEFENLDQAVAAKQEMHNHRVEADRTIIVDYSEPDPFNTPEGQERHEQALAKKEERYKKFHKTTPSEAALAQPPAVRRTFKPTIKTVYGTTRQSTYDARTHHSKVGAKFSTKTRSKRK